MHLPSKLLIVLGIFCSVALPRVYADLKADMAALSTPEEKLVFLQKHTGEDASTDLAAALIQSAPPDAQKEIAIKVAQLLAGTGNPAEVAAKLISQLPGDVAAQVAGSIILGIAKDSSQIPQITAAVLVSQPETIRNAASITAEVIAGAPLEIASKIAAEIGKQYPKLIEQVPQIAAEMTRALLAKGKDEQTRTPIGETIAALTSLLPDATGQNKETVLNIGKAISEVLSTTHPNVAATIVIKTAEAMYAAAGDSTSTPTTITNFENTFNSNLTDANQKQQLSSAVAQIVQGDSSVSIPLVTSTENMPGQAFGHSEETTKFTYDSLVPAETNVLPK
ncbi:MAG: hypothetical protein NTZ46_09565 [Verrucomicrobia bacterium]|nr:hypothetical protein [Verrucomicrobiota bacterium]